MDPTNKINNSAEPRTNNEMSQGIKLLKKLDKRSRYKFRLYDRTVIFGFWMFQFHSRSRLFENLITVTGPPGTLLFDRDQRSH